MRWGSFDPFLTEDGFWQDRMGMPVANKDFLYALLRYGTFDSYHFFCDDNHQIGQFHRILEQHIPGECRRRVKASVQGLFPENFNKEPIDVMHHGDFTTFVPYVMELRNSMPQAVFPVTGITHALDTIKLHTSFIQLLLARPRPYDTIVCTSKCAIKMLSSAFEHIKGQFESVYQTSLPSPPSLTQIPLGISEELFEIKDPAQCRESLELPKDQLVMLSLGRFSPRRKMDLAPLLECIAWLSKRKDTRQSLPPFVLVLAGAGRAGDIKLVQDMVIQLGIQDCVRIEANVSFERKQLLYGAADIFISLVDNYQETFGLSIIEAMAQGLPVIATDFNGYKELVVHERTGFLIPTIASIDQEPWESLLGMLNFSILRLYRAQKISFDIERLALAITTLATNPTLRLEMGKRARVRSMAYRWPFIIPLYEELWLNRKKEAEQWAALNGRENRHPRMLVPTTSKFFSHYPTEVLKPDSRITLSEYGRERCMEGFQPILYEEMLVFLNQDYLNHLTYKLSGSEWMVGTLLQECQSHFGASRDIMLVQLDWLMKHGYVRVLL